VAIRNQHRACRKLYRSDHQVNERMVVADRAGGPELCERADQTSDLGVGM
jgi:hypothetical protein